MKYSREWDRLAIILSSSPIDQDVIINSNVLEVYSLEWAPNLHRPIVYFQGIISTFSTKIAPFQVQSFGIHPKLPFIILGCKAHGAVGAHIFSL